MKAPFGGGSYTLRMKPVLATVVLIACTPLPRAEAQVAQFRHVAFITSSTHNVNASCEPNSNNGICFGGHMSADQLATYRAFEAGFIPSWNGNDNIYKAVISTTIDSAKQHVPILGAVYNMHGDLLAVDANDFWDGTLLTGINYNENGQLLPNTTTFWTGSTS